MNTDIPQTANQQGMPQDTRIVCTIASVWEDDRSIEYNPHGGNAFGRVHGNRYPIVRAHVNPDALDGLARFLAKNVRFTINHRGSLTVRCYTGETEADVLRQTQQDLGRTEAIVKMFNLESKAASINDYLFPKIRPTESVEDYYQRVADGMVDNGIRMVEVTYAGWNGRRVFFV